MSSATWSPPAAVALGRAEGQNDLGVGMTVAVGGDSRPHDSGLDSEPDLVFAALDLPARRLPVRHWLLLRPQAASLRETLGLAGVAHAAVYVPPSLQLGLAWLARQQDGGARIAAPQLAALQEQVAGWMLALRRIPTCIARARAGDARAECLQRARRALHAHLPTRGGLDAMADTAGLTRGQLTRVLRRGCGLSAGRYRSELRLRRAALLLLVEEQRCAEAAAAVGYRSVSQFSLEFSQLYGVRPSRLVGLVEGMLGGVPAVA